MMGPSARVQTDIGHAGETHRAAATVLTVGIGVMGVLMAHWPMLISGFGRIQTDLVDTRLIHYLLEHGYRWVRGLSGHEDFWSPPFFFPVANVAAYSDTLLAVGPVYWVWRSAGFSPDLSFGLWMVSMSVLNYLAGLLLFRAGFGFGWPAAAGGAALIAFGAPRVNQMGHQQLLPCFYVLIAVYALARLAGGGLTNWQARGSLWLLAALSVVAQLYSGVYLGWLLVMAAAVVTVGALALPSCRGRLLAILRQDAWAITGPALIGLLLLQPFLSHYGKVAAETRGRQFHWQVVPLHPNIASWFYMGKGSWVWGWMASRQPFRSLQLGPEHQLGVGLLTLIVCAAGLFMGRRRPMCQLAALVIVTAWFGTTRLPGNDISRAGMIVGVYCLAGLFHERDHQGSRAKALLAIVVMLLVDRFPNENVLVLGLSALVLCLFELVRSGRHNERVIEPAIAVAAIGLVLFPIQIVLTELLIVASAAVLMGAYFRHQRWQIGLGAACFWILLLVITTYLDRPAVLLDVVWTVPISMVVGAQRWARLPARLLMWGLVVALPFAALFSQKDSLWLEYSRLIPGAVGIRAVGRVALICLIAAAAGLACFVQTLERKRWTIAGWGIILLCLAEQVVMTDSFDAAANRTRIESVARRVNRGRGAFFYYNRQAGLSMEDQLDAMWASLASEVPTVNGYSGYHPRVWDPFYLIKNNDRDGVPRVLAKWEQFQRLGPGSVQWIDGNDDGEGRELPTKAQASVQVDASNVSTVSAPVP